VKRQLQPKRARSDTDAGDAHEILAEVDNWDLRDHRREACSRVRGRGLGSQSSGPHLLVAGSTRTKQTAWIEDQFTVTSSAGIRNREKRVADIVVRELNRAKPGVWGCIQAHEVWSSEEEANMRPGHFWICKLGTFPGSMTCEYSCVERKFELQDRKCKWEEYKGTRYSDGDSALVVELWLHRVADDSVCHVSGVGPLSGF
jgi:hypothetical protein